MKERLDISQNNTFQAPAVLYLLVQEFNDYFLYTFTFINPAHYLQ